MAERFLVASRFPIFPDHEVLAELGRGSLGVVYKALSRRFRDLRAVKRIPAADRDLVHRIKREIRALSHLEHPTLVKPSEVFELHDSICLSSDLIEGRDILSFLGPQPASEPERMRQAVYLFGQVLRTLAYLHEHDFVHRGIKPTNLLVTRDAQLKLTDPGLSREVTPGPSGALPVDAGAASLWLAPEQLLGQPVDGRSDLYSLGLVIYQALAGQRPHGTAPLASELLARARSEALPLKTGEPRVDRALSPLLSRLLARSPDARYRSAGEVFGDLKLAWEEFSAGRGPAAPGPVPAERRRKRAAEPPAGAKEVRPAPVATTAQMPALPRRGEGEDTVRIPAAARREERKTPVRESGAITRPDLRAVAPEPPARRRPGASSTSEIRISDLKLAEALSAETSTSLPRIGPALVGREAEVARLTDALAHAVTGAGRMLVVSGLHGMGKTRLLAELAVMARADGLPVLQGREEDRSAGPMGPITSLIDAIGRRLLRLTPAERSPLLPPEASALAGVSPSFREMVTAENAATDEGEDPTRRRYRLRAALSQVLRNLSVAGPLVLILEDLHLCDEEAAQVLAHLVRTLLAEPSGQRPPVLLATSLRAEEVPRTHPVAVTLAALEEEGRVERIELNKLDEAAVSKIAASMLGVDSLPAELPRRLARDTGGNPLLVVETIRMLRDQGLLKLEGGALKIDPAALRKGTAIQEKAAKPALAQALAERVARLPAATQEILRMGAVSGREFRFELLRELLHRPEGELLDALREAVRAGIVSEPQGSPGRFVFERPEAREGVLQGVAPPALAALSQRVARALERVLGGRRFERALDLAGLFDRAGDAARAVEYLPHAAEEKTQAGDLRGALELHARLIELLALLPAAARAKHISLELEARKHIARIHLAAGELKRARGEFEELLRRASQTRRQPDEIDSLNGLAEACWKSGDRERAEEAARTAWDKARAISYTAGIAQALENRGIISRRAFDLREASQWLRESLRLRRSMADENGTARVLSSLAVVFRTGDQLDKARKHFEEARAIHERRKDRLGIAVALAGLASVSLREDRYDEALRLFRDSREHDVAMGNPRGVALCDQGTGSVHLASGAYREALEHFERSFTALEAMGDKPNAAYSLINLGHTYHRTGNHREAVKRYRDALAMLEGTGNRVSESEARSGLALALLATGDRTRAAEHAQAAVAAAHAAGAREKEAWARHTLATVTGSVEEATRALTLAEESGNGNLICQLHHQLALIALEAADRERAREHFQKAFTIIDSLAERSGSARDSFLRKPHIAAIFRDARKL